MMMTQKDGKYSFIETASSPLWFSESQFNTMFLNGTYLTWPCKMLSAHNTTKMPLLDSVWYGWWDLTFLRHLGHPWMQSSLKCSHPYCTVEPKDFFRCLGRVYGGWGGTIPPSFSVPAIRVVVNFIWEQTLNDCAFSV